MVQVGSVLWRDKNYKVQRLPSIVEGSEFEALPYRLEPDVNLVIDVDQVTTVYVALHLESYSDNLTDWFHENDWSEVEEKITYDGKNTSETLDNIWSKEYLGKAVINITSQSAPLTMAIFIKPGLYFVR